MTASPSATRDDLSRTHLPIPDPAGVLPIIATSGSPDVEMDVLRQGASASLHRPFEATGRHKCATPADYCTKFRPTVLEPRFDTE